MANPSTPSDARTIQEVLGRYEAQGHTTQFAARPDGMVMCFSCRTEAAATDVGLEALERLEGASDPDDMVAVAAVACCNCEAKGTLVLKYGPDATPEDSDVLLALEGRTSPDVQEG